MITSSQSPLSTSLTIPHLTTALTGPLLQLERHIHQHQHSIECWFRDQWKQTPPPLYASTDLRNAGFKVAPVDTNLFPAGFNNLSPELMPICVQASQATITEICSDVTQVLVIPESHTRNVFYLESLAVLVQILRTAGLDVRLGSLDSELVKAQTFQLPSGRELIMEPLERRDNRVGVKDFFPCCVVLNNDLSAGMPEILQNLEKQRLMPSAQLGWNQRLKSTHFSMYQTICEEFGVRIGLDPWLLSPLFDQCEDVDFTRRDGYQALVDKGEALFAKIEQKYREHGITDKPFLVVKADQGTYGMAVMMIDDPAQLSELNRKQRNNMSRSKGGSAVTKVLLQEGVHSIETIDSDDGSTSAAEPVVYLFGRHVIGGFYRTHQQRGPADNLNTPGMDFTPLSFARPGLLAAADEPVNRFYLYGVISRLAVLAAARELSDSK